MYHIITPNPSKEFYESLLQAYANKELYTWILKNNYELNYSLWKLKNDFLEAKVWLPKLKALYKKALPKFNLPTTITSADYFFLHSHNYDFSYYTEQDVCELYLKAMNLEPEAVHTYLNEYDNKSTQDEINQANVSIHSHSWTLEKLKEYITLHKHNQPFVILTLEKLNQAFEEFKQENNIKNVNEQGMLNIFLKQYGLDCLTLELTLFNLLFYKKLLNNKTIKKIKSNYKKY
ncbi:hypothetical protein [Ureaplasma diversum]|uniref:Uncharacterized protein n=1 Tax=Ureaplasma diversum NCTC 246 TaxID=1188241 RepID=A0A084EZ30_9BACT|nr:hypothetical protein [Ureaplasma diversum]KEZ23222.1 hypothetical protein UDIV_3860 [Ureaplasma diversum NCTC 246]